MLIISLIYSIYKNFKKQPLILFFPIRNRGDNKKALQKARLNILEIVIKQNQSSASGSSSPIISVVKCPASARILFSISSATAGFSVKYLLAFSRP